MSEFYHNVSNEPGEVVIEIRAEFRHAESGTVQVRDFREVEKVSQFDSHGALLAFDAGSARIVEAIAIWTGILGC
ncbi:MAG: hypothetical protein DCC75_10665 [Proteobacteria bacterium]|nr:MAG: hypothetical protein DCC75_10665 [Pseudomonadota bacterium]